MRKELLLAVIYLVMDVVWITTMSSLLYNTTVKNVQKTEMIPNLLYAVLSYVTLLIAIFYVCIPLSKQYNSVMVFGLVGFVIYGVYNFTNGAIFSDYDWKTVVIDTVWGVVSFTIVGQLYKRM